MCIRDRFVTPQGLIVNEIAPRVHNSGHWTQNGCAVDQFEQHIRAVAGLPLGDGARHTDVVMENLIGDDIARLPALLRERDCAVHLYGKTEAVSYTHLDVYKRQGVDSLYSIVQMPKGYPVATMAIGAAGAANAGLLAAGILALQDPGLATRLDAWRDALSASIPMEPKDD